MVKYLDIFGLTIWLTDFLLNIILKLKSALNYGLLNIDLELKSALRMSLVLSKWFTKLYSTAITTVTTVTTVDTIETLWNLIFSDLILD